MAWKKKKDTQVTRIEPVQVQPQQTPPQPVPGATNVFVSDENTLGRHRVLRTRVTKDAHGNEVTETYEEVVDITGRTVSAAEHFRHEAQAAAESSTQAVDDIPEEMSKRRLLIGGLLAVLVVMILMDVVGVPHVRTEPGRYASLDGVETIDNPDAPLVILKRLDRSVFAYTVEGIGWCFGVIGEMISGDKPTPPPTTE